MHISGGCTAVGQGRMAASSISCWPPLAVGQGQMVKNGQGQMVKCDKGWSSMTKDGQGGRAVGQVEMAAFSSWPLFLLLYSVHYSSPSMASIPTLLSPGATLLW